MARHNTNLPSDAERVSKKRKRKSKHAQADEADATAVIATPANLTEDGSKSKKKRRKRLGEVENQAVTPIENDQTVDEEQSSHRDKSKKKKKDKKKHRHREPEPDVAEPSSNESATSTSNNMFLSAVMTAAAGTNPQLQIHDGYPVFGPVDLSQGAQDPLSAIGVVGLNGSISSEDLARSLNSVDVANIADALRALGGAGVSTFSLPASHQQSSNNTDSTTGQRNNKSSHGSRKPSVPPSTPAVSDEHAQILSQRWLNATKLNQLADEIGLVFKKGKFSVSESETLKQAIESYRIRNGMSEQQLNELIFTKGTRNKDNNAFWFDITATLPQRPVIAVYHYVRRSYHPMAQRGKWTEAEDKALEEAVNDLGTSWEKVSERVGRMSGDCRDRWRNHIHKKEGRNYGTWTAEEEKRLTGIVTEMQAAQGGADSEIFWTLVAEKMGNRGRQQCRIKWTDALSKRVKNGGVGPRWSQNDAYILVQKVAAQNVNDDSEIDWKKLIDDDWNLWSAHTIQRRWMTLKRSVKGHEDMSHQEIMDILRAKKSHPPAMPVNPSKRIISAETVPAEVQANDIALDESNFMIPPAPHAGFEDVSLPSAHAANPYVLGPGPLDPTLPQQQFTRSFEGPTSATGFEQAFSEAGPSTSGGSGSGKVQSDELSDDDSSDSSSDSDDDSDED